MPICPSCQKTIHLKRKLAGRQVKCPGCQTILSIPTDETSDCDSIPIPQNEILPIPDEQTDTEKVSTSIDIPSSEPTNKKFVPSTKLIIFCLITFLFPLGLYFLWVRQKVDPIPAITKNRKAIIAGLVTIVVMAIVGIIGVRYDVRDQAKVLAANKAHYARYADSEGNKEVTAWRVYYGERNDPKHYMIYVEAKSESSAKTKSRVMLANDRNSPFEHGPGSSASDIARFNEILTNKSVSNQKANRRYCKQKQLNILHEIQDGVYTAISPPLSNG